MESNVSGISSLISGDPDNVWHGLSCHGPQDKANIGLTNHKLLTTIALEHLEGKKKCSRGVIDGFVSRSHFP